MFKNTVLGYPKIDGILIVYFYGVAIDGNGLGGGWGGLGVVKGGYAQEDELEDADG